MEFGIFLLLLLLSIGAVTTIDGGQRSVAKGGGDGANSDITDAGNPADGPVEEDEGEKMSPKGTNT